MLVNLACLGIWLFHALPTVGEVSCGGQRRVPTCADCARNLGKDWCEGDCIWSGDECVLPTASGFPFPPDTRPQGCTEVTEDLTSHRVSVIIPWLKEKWEHMEGTMHALLYFTPPNLIEEIIFVSDGNRDSREQELKALSDKVVVVALPERNGLIRAKMKGVAIAKAPVLVFLEAHVIVNREWLQPLLQRVVSNPRTLAMPALDYIPADNWHAYWKAQAGHWRYEWNFNLIYTNPGGLIRDTSDPYMTPGTSGGIFAMRKDWFEHLGLFDPKMLEWGGDHFELTMKVWRCGGRIEIIPCSRIGHLFREVATRPYSVSEWQVVHNYARLAQVWATDHLHLFYRVKPQARFMWLGDLTEQKKTHELLNCKGLDWYIENIDHELKWEADHLCLWTWNPVNYFHWCKNDYPPGRSTIDHVMPVEEFVEAKKAAAARGFPEVVAPGSDNGSIGPGSSPWEL